MTMSFAGSPTGVLSEAKRLLLEQRLRGLSGAGAPVGVRRRAGGTAPLSPAQHGVWIADQLRADTTLSGVHRVMWLRGQLDVAALRAALDGLVARHEILRTTYRLTGEGPEQVVGPVTPVGLRVENAAGVSADARREDALRLAREAVVAPFDLAAGPLFGAMVVVVDPEEHLLVIRMHHLLTDEWSCGLLARELEALYAAHRAGRDADLADLPDLPVQYADYAAWLAEPAQVERRGQHLDHWRETLTGVPPVLELPTDRIRPDQPSYRGGVERRTLSREATAGLRQLAADHGATMFHTLLALFGVVLSRYSGQRRFAVGSLLSGRGRSEVEHLLGMFASTVAIPVDVTAAPSFADLLDQVRGVTVGALDHQDATFDQVVAALQLPREAGRNPLFQVLFQCVEASEHQWRLDGLDCELVWLDTGLAKVDLTLIAVNDPDGIALELTYAADLYQAETAGRLLDYLANVADAAVADAATRVIDADMLSAAERHRAVVEWNDTAMDYPTSATVHGLVEKWAAQAPERPAIWRLDGTPVSYGELNAQANQLAHYLRDQGVGRETLVGVCLDHSVEMFVVLLGVLKSGAAYVPLDAALPTQRLEWILTDTAAPMVVTTEALRDAVPEAFGGRLVRADTDWPAIAAFPTHDPEPLSDSGNLLYIIYTSGSTGRPKGVLVPHQGVVNYLWWAIDGYGLAGERGAPMLGSIAFDLSVPNFWLPLIGGKCVTLLPTDKSLESLAGVLREPGDFSLLKITPGHLDVLRGMLEPGDVESVRTFVVGADEVRPETVSGWRAVAPHARIINEYGPTETVVGCSVYVVPDGFDPSISVSIGKPIGNLTMYVLDAGLHPVPVGVVGELYIGGDGVARGYHNRPELTAEKFVPDPFGRPGDRLYRTGDLARYRADGDFEFLGRTDFQVKVRGYRIELGEVEARLGLHPEVTEAVAAAVTDKNGHKRLVGYVVAADRTTPPTAAELREFMAATLPEYMVPSVFVVLDAMPLTSAGKVDRTALPAPGAVAGGGFEGPRTPREHVLADIWSEVLGVPRIGVRDNFFELGGDSILAISVVAKARQAGLGLTPALMFQRQTVAELAAAAVASGELATAGAEQGPVTGDVPLTPVQHWFTALDLPRDHYNQANLVTFATPPDETRLRAAVTTLVRHHDALRLRLAHDDDGRWHQFVAAPDGAHSFEVVGLTGLGDAAARAAMAAAASRAHSTLDLADGPLVRALLFRSNGRAPDALLIVVHHIAVDVVSWRILREDLDAAYRGEALPDKTTSFQHWARRLAAHADSADFAGEVAFWQGRADELAAVPPLPTDFPADDNLLGDAAAVVTRVPAAETAALLRQVVPAYRARFDEVLLTALGRAASAVWAGDAVAVDLEGHGREDLFDDVDLTRTVGWFTTLHPVVLRTDGDRPADWLRAVKQQVRAAPRRGIGYGLARLLRGDGGLSQSASDDPAICFNYVGVLDDIAFDAPGVERAPSGRRPYLIDITASVTAGELVVSWQYGTGCHDEATVEQLSRAFVVALREIAAGCGAGHAAGTASDFPLAELPQAALDTLADAPGLVGVADVYRLSPLQTGMLYQTAAEPERGDYVEQFVYAFDGSLDPAALRAAWQHATDRHAILRTSFAWRGLPHPVQLVHRRVAVSWEELDWRDVAEGDLTDPAAEGELAGRIAALRRRELPLDGGPPQHFQLIRVGAQDWRLVWLYHHILLDGWSVPIVLGDVAAAYRELAAGGVPPELPDPVPFRDHIAWLSTRQRVDGAYWRSALAGVTVPTPISVVAPDADGGGAVRIARARLPRTRADELSDFARGHRITLGSLLHAAWALLLARDSGRADVVFGSTSAGRSGQVPGTDQMVGMLMNTLPARITVTDEPVGDWLRGVHAALGSLREHEHTALVDVQRAAGVAPGEPLFDSIVVYENFSGPDGAATGGFTLKLAEAYEQTGYPLVLGAGMHDELSLALSFDTARVEPDGARRLLAAYQGVLDELVAPDARLSALAPTTDAIGARTAEATVVDAAPVAYVAPRDDTERLLAGLWVDVLDVPRVGVHDDFIDLGGDSILAMRIVAAARDAGVVLRPRDLFKTPTVAELARLAVAPAAAAVSAPREAAPTAELVADRFPAAAVAAVHHLAPLQTGMLFHALGDEAGTDYVQVFTFGIDEEVDESAFRRAWQAAVDRHDALRTVFAWQGLRRPVQVVLRQATVGFRSYDYRGLSTVEREARLRELLAAERTEPVDLSAAPPTRITLVHTEPAVYRCHWRSHHILLDGISAPAVLAEAFENYRALAGGGELPIRPAPASFGDYLAWRGGQDRTADDAYWRRVLAGFAVATATPPADTGMSGGPVSGELAGSGLYQCDVPAELVDGVRDAAKRHRVTVGAVLHAAWALLLSRYAGSDDVVFGTTLTGRSAPVSGVDEMVGMLMNTLPVRIATGDTAPVGRWLKGIHQGLVELREHEHCALADVQRQASLPKGQQLFDTILVFHNMRHVSGSLPDGVSAVAADSAISTGYPVIIDAIWESGGDSAGRLLLQLSYLRCRYSEATAVRLLDQFTALLSALATDTAATPGELAVRVLPDVAAPAPRQAAVTVAPTGTARYVAPRSDVERQIADIWCDVLGVGRVGVADNFFDLGGDSILSIQIVAQARQAGLALTTKHMFAHHTVAELARVVEAAAPVAVHAQQSAVSGAVPLTPIQRWFTALDWPHDHYNQAVALRWTGPVDAAALDRALRTLVDHHDGLRLRLVRDGDGWRQHIAATEKSELLRVVDLPAGDQATAMADAADAAQCGLRLADGPLLRAVLCRELAGRHHQHSRELVGRHHQHSRELADRDHQHSRELADRDHQHSRELADRHHQHSRRGATDGDVVVLAVHHIAVDTVSWNILLEDLAAAYDGRDLPAKTTSFQHWAQRLTEYAASDAFAAEAARWATPAPAAAPLPVDRDGGPNTEGSTRIVTCGLPPEATELLLRAPAAYRARVNDLLTTALARTLAEWTGAPDVGFDVEAHGREPLFDDVDLSRTVGWFTAVHPVQVRMPDDPGDVAGGVKAVKQRLHDMPHHGIGHGLAALRGDVAATAAEVIFNYHGQSGQRAASGPFGFADIPVGTTRAPAGVRSYLLEVDAAISGGRLAVEWKYSTAVHDRSTVEDLAARYVAHLHDVVRHCAGAAGATPSDFPLAGLDQAELDGLLARTDPAGVEDVYPLSPLQSGMLFRSLYRPDGGDYLEQFGFQLDGDLDVAAFGEAWRRVVHRHPVLRSTFVWDGLPRPMQVVHREVDVTVGVTDRSTVDPEALDDRFAAWLADERGRGFDVQAAPPQRFDLFRVGPDAHRFVWQCHHLQLDGWSTAVVLAEVFAAYREIRDTGDTAEPAPRPLFRDHIDWQQAQDQTAANAFWESQLAGLYSPTALPLDRSHAAPAETRHVVAQVPAAVTDALREVARRERVTMNAVVHAAWALLLSRYSGERDVLFGTTVAGRSGDVAGVEQMVGMLMNTVPIRVAVDDRGPVPALLRDVYDRQVALRDHEHSTLPDIQRCSPIPSGQPLFDSILVFENFTQDDEAPTDLRVSEIYSYEQTEYPLALAVNLGDRLNLKLNYQSGRVDAATAERIVGHVVEVLTHLAAADRVGEVDILTAAERTRLVYDWNADTVPYQVARAVHEDFAHWAATTPDAPAVMTVDGTAVSYAALDATANRLAHRLRDCGVGAETLVGVCVGHSVAMFAALLGVLKAGGAYVPLDPDHPVDRIGYMLADSGAAAVVTTPGQELPADFTGTVVVIDGTADLAEWPDHAPDVAVDLENLAYVMYTSGSTGRPKGVQVPHRALANFLTWSRAAWDHGDGGALLTGSITFDMSVCGVWVPLVAGRPVRLLRRDPSLGSLAEALTGGDTVNMLMVTPGHFNVLRSLLPDGAIPMTGTFAVGGEEVHPAMVAGLRQMAPHARICNVYGPTETVVICTSYEVPDDHDPARPVPIGRPVANSRIYLLDPHLRPVPVGVTGEVYVGGDGVTRGYRDRPALTAEKFVPDPFGPAGGRLYRTGDLARYRADGAVEFLGRRDNQVKIRGYRIELGEIEARLASHPAVAEAVVVARTEADGHRRLVAYLVAADMPDLPDLPDIPDIDELRDHLRRELPEYMVPSVFVPLPELPLGATGKVDRTALPAPETSNAIQAAGDGTPPRNPVERTLAEVWSAVLGAPVADVDADFFDVGGDSILAISVVAQARRAGLTVPLRHLYEGRTIAALARAATVDGDGQRGTLLDQLPDLMREYGVPGISAALFDWDGIVETRTYGLAGGDDPVGPDTVFQGGSMSKSFSAMLVLKLVQDGVLDLDEDINRYLGEWRPGRPMTLRQLLSHTAGLNLSEYEQYRRDEPLPSLDDVLAGRPPARSAPLRLEAEPGTRYLYANSNYSVVEKVLVAATGEEFVPLVRRRVLAPLGLGHSDFGQEPPTTDLRRVARAHDHDGAPVDGGWRVVPELAAGALWSTPTDVARFWREVVRAADGRSTDVLDPASARTMLTPVGNAGYGLGALHLQFGERTVIGHGGEMTGFHMLALFERQAGTGIVVMTNGANGRDLLDVIRGQVCGGDIAGPSALDIWWTNRNGRNG